MVDRLHYWNMDHDSVANHYYLHQVLLNVLQDEFRCLIMFDICSGDIHNMGSYNFYLCNKEPRRLKEHNRTCHL